MKMEMIYGKKTGEEAKQEMQKAEEAKKSINEFMRFDL